MTSKDPFAKLQELDKSKIFDAIDVQPSHLRLNFAEGMRQDVTAAWGAGIKSIVISGMGGSGLAGEIVKNWLGHRLSVPLLLAKGYHLPGFVDEHTLVIVSSYSGNTEEALASLDQAEKLNAQIVVMTAGGKLLQIAKKRNYLVLQLPKVSQPRFSALAATRALGCLLGDMRLGGELDLRRELLEAADFLDQEKSRWSLDQTGENEAKQIAQKLKNLTAIIYSGPALAAAGYKWKININENAKQLAFANVFPELNHNEFQGWIFPKLKQTQVVCLQSSFDINRIKKRMRVTREIIGRYGYKPIEVEARGRTLVEQILWTIMFGDYVSAYLGILNDIDPTPVKLVEQLKKSLG